MQNIITLDEISKKYIIGELHRSKRLSETILNLVKSPFGRGRKEKFWALKNISFSAKEGEVIGIIGRNGAGKSTLLKILSKITYPTSGTMDVSGRVSSLLEVGTGFHDELTGRENIFLNGSILGMKKKIIDKKLNAIIDFAGVKKFIDTPVKRYSSGMRLRLGFAVAAHLEAEVLLIDEILAVGDAEFQKKCLNVMGDLGGKGRTVVFVSHNMTAVENLCSRVIWIDNGELREDGKSTSVIKKYLSSFSESENNYGDFNKTKNRIGDGKIYYTGIEFLSHERMLQNIFRTGDGMVIRLHFHAKAMIQVANFGLEIFTETGTFITSINTWSAGIDVNLLPPGDGMIELEIDSINFMPGRYYISLWLDGAREHYDRLDYIAKMDIQETDYYGSGRGMNSKLFGIIVVPCKWILNGQNSNKSRTS